MPWADISYHDYDCQAEDNNTIIILSLTFLQRFYATSPWNYKSF